MELLKNKLYLEDIDRVANTKLPWDRLKDKNIVLSGATGMIGSFFVDVIMYLNKVKKLNCNLFALTRDSSYAESRFRDYLGSPYINYMSYDVNHKLDLDKDIIADFVVHLASNTHPVAYSTDPIGTITTNIIGLQNMLDFATKHKASRTVFASSNEIYGENRGDVDEFHEDYCGYINCNTMRAGYTESKRCGEALCQAYIKQKNIDVVIARLTRTYGPTMLQSDTKAISQFIKKGVSREDIVLKSQGNQYYSYTYVADAVYGLLTIIFYGTNGEAYNVSKSSSSISLKDLAHIVSQYVERQVIFEEPETIEKQGYSQATRAVLNGDKLRGLGWEPLYSIESGIIRTIDILSELG